MSFGQMGAQELRALLETETATIVDTRDPASYAAGHIEGAQHISDENLPDFLERADRDGLTVVYCYHGISSQQASQNLKDNGFENVYNIIGGFEQWRTEFQAT